MPQPPYARPAGRVILPAEARPITLQPPAAQAEWSATVPGGVVWRLLVASVPFSTSATAGSRVPGFQVLDTDGVLLWSGLSTASVGASIPTANVSYGPGMANGGTGGAAALSMGVPDLPFLPGWTIGSRTIGLTAGDQYGAPRLYVVEHDRDDFGLAVAHDREPHR